MGSKLQALFSHLTVEGRKSSLIALSQHLSEHEERAQKAIRQFDQQAADTDTEYFFMGGKGAMIRETLGGVDWILEKAAPLIGVKHCTACMAEMEKAQIFIQQEIQKCDCEIAGARAVLFPKGDIE